MNYYILQDKNQFKFKRKQAVERCTELSKNEWQFCVAILYLGVANAFSKFHKPTPRGGCRYWHGALKRRFYFVIR